MHMHPVPSSILFGLVLLFCPALSGGGFLSAQDQATSAPEEHMIERVRGLEVDSITRGVTVYYAPGSRERAETLGPMLAEGVRFFEDSLGVSLEFRLALLGPDQWSQVRNSPFGLPFVSGGEGSPYVAVLPANGGGAVYEGVIGLESTLSPAMRDRLRAAGVGWDEAVRTMVDLIGFHEIGHAYADAYGIGRPARWFNEFIASYLAYAYMHTVQPELAEVWDVMGEAILEGHVPEHRTLETFERLYSRVGVPDYGWYQSAFEVRANPLVERHGLSFVRQVKELFPARMEQLPPGEVLVRLDRIAPGFLEWARVFEPQ